MPRSHLADERERPGMLVADTGMHWYPTDVATRAQLCINMWLRAAMYAQGKNIAPRRSFFSDKAEAQVGRGLQNAPAGNLDAAHLMNTSFRPEQLDRGWEGNPPLRQIYYASAATTLQFATSNRSADKVIDGVQTEIKNDLFDSLTKTTRIDQQFVELWLRTYLVTLLAALQSGAASGAGADLKSKSYQTAYTVTATQIARAKSVAGDIADDIAKWATEI